MLCSSDFKISKNRVLHSNVKNNNLFSVIWNKKNITNGFLKYNFTNAAKPLIYFTSLFGSQIISYHKSDTVKVKTLSKLHSFSVICLIIILIVFVKPKSWGDTKSDIPLNILTKTYGFLNTVEVIYSIFVVSFGNSVFYVELFKTIDSVDNHYGISKGTFIRGRIMAWILILLPILQVLSTFWLIRFHLNNTGAHLSFFLIVLQGAIIVFLVIHIYSQQIILNTFLSKKIFKALTPQKMFLLKDSIDVVWFKKLFTDPKILERKLNSHFCWYELMQIYDKISDSIRIFNKIYAGQVLLMFISWLVCTLLTICRSLSPTVKYSDVIINDLFMYTSINFRPIFLAKMCELYMKERRKTLSILLYYLVHGIDETYSDQVQTMIDLVTSRKLEVSTGVFTVDLPTVTEFAGRVISYTVLMIQYFYMHVFSK